MSFPVSQKKPFPFSSVSYKIAFIFLFPLLVFAFTIASPLHPFVDGTPYTDSSVFETVAMMMQRGYMPYRDSFDHKGPVFIKLHRIFHFPYKWRLGSRVLVYAFDLHFYLQNRPPCH